MDKICAFTGHRAINAGDIDKLNKDLDEVVKKLYLQGVRTFRVGGAVGFDTLAACAVLGARAVHKDIELEVDIPCFNQDKFFTDEQRKVYLKILKVADRKVFMSREYTAGCMQKRNRYMIDGADYCVCYLRKKSGGTFYTVNYARENGVEVIEL